MAVGVIVPVRAPAPYLAAALESVLAQQPAPDEVVVVDDGSDPPVALPPAAAGRCALVRLPAGAGPAAARQAGLERLTADLVALADADDVWEAGKLAAQLDALARHADAAVCFGRAAIVGPDGRPTGERWPAPAPGLHAGAGLRRMLFESNPIPAASAVIRRGALETVGGFAPEGALPAGSDWDLWLRLAAAGQAFVCEPRARIRYRRHPGGVTSDVAALAEAAIAIHARHAGLVDAASARRVRAADLAALGHGRIRQRRYGEARAALAEAAALAPAPARDRVVRALAAVPGLRAALGRRDPYRRVRWAP